MGALQRELAAMQARDSMVTSGCVSHPPAPDVRRRPRAAFSYAGHENRGSPSFEKNYSSAPIPLRMIHSQIDLVLMPRGSQPPQRSDEGYFFMPLPRTAAPLARGMLVARLGAPQDFGELSVFKCEGGHRIDMCLGEDDMEIWGRMDRLVEHHHFCHVLCDLASTLDCQLFIPLEGVVVEPDVPELTRMVQILAPAGTTAGPQVVGMPSGC